MGGFGQAPFGAFPWGMAATETEIANWRPAQDSAIPRLAVVEFDVMNSSWDDVELAVRAVFGNGTVETVWSEEGKFSELYRRGSLRRKTGDGHHYVLRRTTGWIGAVLRVDVLTRNEPAPITPTPPQVIPDGVTAILLGENQLMGWRGALVIQSAPVDEPIMPYRTAAITNKGRVIVAGASIVTTQV